MRRWVLLVALAAAALPAPAQQRVTVAELKHFLSAQYAAHRSDGFIADHLGEFELSEQLTEPMLDQIAAELKPEKKTAQQLQLLADESAFLEPPAVEILNRAAPESSEQLRLYNGAVEFANVTIGRLPNFLALRTTHIFDNTILAISTDASRVGFKAGEGLHANGEYSRQVTYREGREVKADAAANQAREQKPDWRPRGLTSTGEFGPLLQIVLSDASPSQVKWSHWEKMRQGTAAVFRYEVPQEDSHETVDFCCVLAAPATIAAGGKSETRSGANMLREFHGTPGYHGYLYLDSETGAVLRVTLVADLGSSAPSTFMGEWVEYGTVQIGEHNYLCPVRSSTMSYLPPWRPDEPGFISLNEVTFTNYHRFGSTAHILSSSPEP